MAVAQVIAEIQIEAQDIPENTHWGEDIQETTEEIQEHINSTDDIPKKGRGRPAGAKNKPKPKPAPAAAKPKAKSKAKKSIEYEESESEEEEAPPPRRRGRQVSGIQPPLTLTHERERERERWNSTDMLWLQTCLAFCSSKGISELLRDAVTMPAGLRIYSKVNGKETDDKQGCSRKVNSDQTTECTATSQGSSND